uniref:Putative 5-amp-activated protein kin n=1 Tax=Rhipicephalus pulchellus TaxID=72859 RepID=L7LYR4_RHIPC
MLPLLPQAPKQGMMHQPQISIQNAEVQKQRPVVPAVDSLPKPGEGAVKPLDIIRRRQEVQQPLFQQQVPVVPESKPSLVQQPKPVLKQAPQVLPLDTSQFAKQAAQVKAEAPAKFLGKPLEVKDQAPRVAPVQEPDNRPLVRKMSRDVKREAPVVAEAPSVVDAVASKDAVVPLDAVASKNAAVAVVPTVLPVGDGKKDVPAKNSNVAAISEVAVKLEPKNISPSLPSHVPADVMLAKHEIRK